MRLTPKQRSRRVAGMVAVLVEATAAAFGRAVQSTVERGLDPKSHSARMLLQVAWNPDITNIDIAERLDVDPSQVSRSGRQLLEQGLAIATPIGRVKAWRLTPRGEHAASTLRQRVLAPEPPDWIRRKKVVDRVASPAAEAQLHNVTKAEKAFSAHGDPGNSTPSGEHVNTVPALDEHENTSRSVNTPEPPDVENRVPAMALR